MKCETIPELKRFLTIQEQALGSGSPEVATTVSKLADLYLDRGMLDDAEALYRRALSIRERLSGVHRSEMEDSKRSLNKVLALKGDRLERVSNEMRAAGHGSGRPNMQGASRAAPQNGHTGPKMHPTSPITQSGHQKQIASSAANNRVPPLGSHPGVSQNKTPANSAPTTDNYGRRMYDLSPDQNGHTASKQDMESWYSASSKQKQSDTIPPSGAAGGGKDHPKDTGWSSFHPHDSSTVLDAIPDHLHLTSNAEALQEAIKEARLEVDLVRQLTGGDAAQLADCLTRLADLLCRCRLYKEMEPILLEALNIREKRFGLSHHMVATSLKNLARLYYFEGYYDRALPLFERAILIRRRVFGENNVRVADVLEQYAKLLRKMQRHTEALRCDQESQAIRSRSQGWRPL
jgi:tetratricopeptide (TPR) repeat protein